MAGHGLLSIPRCGRFTPRSPAGIGNGFFKPNVSTMVGNLYPEGSHLKDRAYNIFYMGINVGAISRPDCDGDRQSVMFGFHAAFAVAAFGWCSRSGFSGIFKKRHCRMPEKRPQGSAKSDGKNTAATAVDAPPTGVSRPGRRRRRRRKSNASGLDDERGAGRKTNYGADSYFSRHRYRFWMVFSSKRCDLDILGKRQYRLDRFGRGTDPG